MQVSILNALISKLPKATKHSQQLCLRKLFETLLAVTRWSSFDCLDRSSCCYGCVLLSFSSLGLRNVHLPCFWTPFSLPGPKRSGASRRPGRREERNVSHVAAWKYEGKVQTSASRMRVLTHLLKVGVVGGYDTWHLV